MGSPSPRNTDEAFRTYLDPQEEAYRSLSVVVGKQRGKARTLSAISGETFTIGVRIYGSVL